MKQLLVAFIFLFVLMDISCTEINDLHGIWLETETFNEWQKGNNELLRTREVELAGDLYETVWINLAINLKETPQYLEYWGFKCIIERIEVKKSVLYLVVHSRYNDKAKGYFSIKFIDDTKFIMTLINISDELSDELDNAWFNPSRLEPEQIYIRCPRIQSAKVSE